MASNNNSYNSVGAGVHPKLGTKGKLAGMASPGGARSFRGASSSDSIPAHPGPGGANKKAPSAGSIPSHPKPGGKGHRQGTWATPSEHHG